MRVVIFQRPYFILHRRNIFTIEFAQILANRELRYAGVFGIVIEFIYVILWVHEMLDGIFKFHY